MSLNRDRVKLGLGLLIIYGGYTIVFAPVVLWLSRAGAPLVEMGWTGVLLYALAFVILATVMVPSSLMKLVAGALFGFTGGLVAGGLGAFFGAFVPFYMVRYFGWRRWLEPSLEKPMWRALDEAAEENGFIVTALLRLSLVLPYNFSNYLWGATRIRSSDYLKGNLLTFVPTALYAWWGAALGDVAAIVAGTGPERDTLWWATMIFSLILTIGGAIWMHRLAKNRLDQILDIEKSE